MSAAAPEGGSGTWNSAPGQPGLTTTSGYHQVMRRSIAVTAPRVDAAGAVAGSRSAAAGVPSPPDDPDARHRHRRPRRPAGVGGGPTAPAADGTGPA